jgi:enamine deaminase RidA (YjgF/YER057c/UK114 family)
MSERRRISSGGPWEAVAGYSRAIVVGDSCWVAGTTDAGPDGQSLHPGDVAAQARAVLEIIERALAEAGFGLADVVRTRMFVTDIARSVEI